MCILIPLQYHIMPGLSMRYATAGRTGAVNCTEEEEEEEEDEGSQMQHGRLPRLQRQTKVMHRCSQHWQQLQSSA